MRDKIAYMLLEQIADRAQRKAKIIRQNGVTLHLEPYQALIGDYWNVDLSEGEYRQAKKILAIRKYATFKGTNKGTIATLINNEIFDINGEDTTDRTTDKQRTGNEQTTTNKKFQEKKEEKKKFQEDLVPIPPNFQFFQKSNNNTLRDGKGMQRIGDILKI